ncbi:MAG: response regulator [Deltaproteobacteria bacterium]|nr:response regulator [Deltaproteobacteria bacterium]
MKPTVEARALYALVAGLLALVLFIDLRVLPLGIPAWSLYVIPVVACLYAWRPSVPLVVGLVAAVLEGAGYFLKPLPDVPEILRTAQINRSMGFATLLLLGVTLRQFVAARVRAAEQNWVKTGENLLVARLQGEQGVAELGKGSLAFLADYVNAPVGAAWFEDGAGRFRRAAGFAHPAPDDASATVKAGEGLVGQVARDGRLKVVTELPEGSLEVRTGLGTARPRALVLVPTTADGVTNGVIELAFLAPPSPAVLEMLQEVASSVGTAVRSARDRERQAALLEQTRQQAEELRAKQAAITAANEELQATNEELRAANDALDEQGRTLASTAAESQRASHYKSEFLANMSHELRTPLNSLLILAKLLGDNPKGNLTAEQVKFAHSIAASGNDLLTLINDILDLAKIEAGRVELDVESFTVASLIEEQRRRFAPLAHDRNLEIRFTVAATAPKTLETDRMRLSQVLTNLLSNALKFTDQGTVELLLDVAEGERVSFAVKDTGIGIAPEHQQGIFDAFRQADGATNRKYGGTGLGLSISRELTQLLGGEIRLESGVGQGSTFTVVVPRRLARPASPVAQRALLLVEDDPAQQQALVALLRADDLRVVAVATADAALSELRQASFDCVVLDLMLPDLGGIELLERMVKDARSSFPPVIVNTARPLSLDEEQRLRRFSRSIVIKGSSAPDRLLAEVRLALQQGPAERPLGQPRPGAAVDRAFDGRRVLVVEDDIRSVFALTSMLEPQGVSVDVARNGKEALARLEQEPGVDLILMDVMMPEMDGLEATRRIRVGAHHAAVPIITLTAKAMPDDRARCLEAGANDHLAKPIDSEKLLAAMRTWMAR